MFCSHLINFISCVNHDSLTFIVEVMGWSCGLGDSSRGDKCCYLLRARINRVCVQKDTGRVRKKENKMDTEHESPKEVAVQRQILDGANQWAQTGERFIWTMGSIYHFSMLPLWFHLVYFSVLSSHFFPCGLSSAAIYKIHFCNKICQQIIQGQIRLFCLLFSSYSQKNCGIYAIIWTIFNCSST